MRLIPLIRLLTRASKGKVSAEEFLGELGDGRQPLSVHPGGVDTLCTIMGGDPTGVGSGVTFEEALVAYLDAVVRDVASAALAPLIKATAATLSAAILSILMERRRGEQ